ncbi:MAG: PQQ-dependent sugar dehydrogenase, partial [Gammaproteobacteria bacterium]|nr:PQQ-dependent sugar dehydrogenase [Gammaproteobacteria bacterium]
MYKNLLLIASLFLATACSGSSATATADDSSAPFKVNEITSFNEPWAMTFLPDGRLLVAVQPGQLFVVTQDGGKSRAVRGVPNVDYRGQGGLGDVILHPDYENNKTIYLSYAEGGVGGKTRGAAIARGTLEFDERGNAAFTDAKVIWRQVPKVTGAGHYGHRMAFDSDGYLFITSGDRQKFDPAQDMTGNVGKVVR